jgi:hypothetical protein
VFTFDVPRSEGARVYDSDNRPVVVAYHGFLYADGETHSVMRVETRLPEFPAESNVKSMLVTLDYQVTKLGNHEFLLPQGFEIHWARNPKDSLPKTPAGLFPRFSTQPDFAFAEYRNYRPLTARSRRSDAESHAEITFGDATRDQK